MQANQWNLHNIMRSSIGADCGMIFGATGSGKSMLIRAIIQSAVEQNIPVAVCDTEANYTQEDIDWLKANTEYHHTTNLKGITAWVKGLKPGAKVVACDSIGGPAYGAYTGAGNAKMKGNIFLDMAEAMFAIQQYCQENGAMGLVVNQPTSDFTVGNETKEIEPFGGKTNFYAKETIRTERLSPDKGFSWAALNIYKSRHMAPGTPLGKLGISNTVVGIQFNAYVGRQAKAWPETKCVLHNPLLSDKKETVTIKGQPEEAEPPPETTGGEIPVDEGEESEDEKLQSVRTAILGMIDTKNISDELFAEKMKQCSIESKHLEQINSLEEAQRLKEAIEKVPNQKQEKKDDGTFL